MRSSLFALSLLSLSIVSAGPLQYKRQEDGTTVAGGGNDAAVTTTAVDSNGDTSTTAIRDDDPTTPPPSTPSPPTSSPPQDDCGPCSSEGHPTYTSPSGKQCYCIGGSTDPWEWADKNCINDVTGLPNDEGRPYLCLGSGSTPSSRACLSQCNFMLNTVNSANPCSSNLYNAARTCAGCVPGGAIRYQVDGRSPSPPYIQGTDSMNTFMEGMKNWCARPSRCIDLTTGSRISGTGGCPVDTESSTTRTSYGIPASRQTGGNINADPNATPSPAVRATNGGNTTPTPSARIVTTSTISTTGADGRPTFSLQLATIDNPAYTANTAFAGARPSSSPDGSALSTTAVSMSAALASVIAVTVMLVLV